MFERYNEHARRSLFYARYAVAEFGGEAIELEHLLMGLARCDRRWWHGLLASGQDVAVDARLRESQPGFPKLSTSVEVPFSPAVRDVLQATPAAADARGDKLIGPVHLLLALMAHAEGEAVCRQAGIDVDAVRAAVAPEPPGPPDFPSDR